MATCRRKKIDPYSQSYTKFNYKWIKDLSTRPNTLNLTAEKGENVLELAQKGQSDSSALRPTGHHEAEMLLYGKEAAYKMDKDPYI